MQSVTNSNDKPEEKTITNEKEESDIEEMEHESDDSDQSGSGSGDSSEGSSDEASELDEDYVKKRHAFLEHMTNLEKEYMDLHDVIINERVSQIDLKLEEIKCEEAPEYLQPLAELEENMRIRSEVASILRDYRLQNIQTQFDAEEVTAKQNFENEKTLLYDSIEDDLKDRIKHLEEDRNNVDLNADLWLVERGLTKGGKVYKDKKHVTGSKGLSRSSEPNPRRKPVTVSGPYIVYMLRDSEILEDWTLIKKAVSSSNRKLSSMSAVRNELSSHAVNYKWIL